MDMIVGTPEYKSESKRPVRDSVILGVAFLCVFTSYQALQNLQVMNEIYKQIKINKNEAEERRVCVAWLQMLLRVLGC
jgi:hypothetical protein